MIRYLNCLVKDKTHTCNRWLYANKMRQIDVYRLALNEAKIYFENAKNPLMNLRSFSELIDLNFELRQEEFKYSHENINYSQCPLDPGNCSHVFDNASLQYKTIREELKSLIRKIQQFQ